MDSEGLGYEHTDVAQAMFPNNKLKFAESAIFEGIVTLDAIDLYCTKKYSYIPKRIIVIVSKPIY